MKKKTNPEKRMTILLLNLLFVFILSSLAVFYVDGWILHPIAIPGEDSGFDGILAQTDYANATVVDIPAFSVLDRDLIQVEQEGERHLLHFRKHRMSGHFALVSDVKVEPNYTGVVYVGTKLSQRAVYLENGIITNTSGGVQYAQNPHYFAISMIFTAAESWILWLILKKKYPG